MINYFQLANIYIRGVQIKYIKVTIFQKLSYILFLKCNNIGAQKVIPPVNLPPRRSWSVRQYFTDFTNFNFAFLLRLIWLCDFIVLF